MSYDLSQQSAGEYWWKIKAGNADTAAAHDAVVEKNFTSATFPAPEEYLVRTDATARTEFAKTMGLVAQGSYLENPSLYAMDQMYSTGSFPAGDKLVQKNRLKYEPWNPSKFSGYRS